MISLGPLHEICPRHRRRRKRHLGRRRRFAAALNQRSVTVPFQGGIQLEVLSGSRSGESFKWAIENQPLGPVGRDVDGVDTAKLDSGATGAPREPGVQQGHGHAHPAHITPPFAAPLPSHLCAPL